MLALLALPALFQAASSGPKFLDVTAAMGLAIGSDNACWVDIDNDGWTDLIAGGYVWRNDHGKRFERREEVGSVVAADFDNDGFVDLFSFSRMKLYHNVGGKKFEEVPLPPLPPTVTRGACWADFDGDGFVDLFIGGYEDWDRDITYPSMVLMNQKGKGFKLSWTQSTYRARGVTACDFNRSGRASVYSSNYRLQPNNLYSLLGDKWADRAGELNVIATSPGFDGGHSIGACWGDFDNCGEFDLFAGNFAHRDDRGDQPKSRFLRNMGAKAGYKFEDLGTCGVFYQESYASPAAGDVCNSGRLDLFFTTVYGIASFKTPNFPVLYRNGGKFKFLDGTPGSGLEKLTPTYQAAFADFENNGSLGLATAGKLFANRGATGNWIEVRLKGDGVKVNRSAIGAQVRLKLGKETLSRQVEAGTGEGNQNDLKLHFGLGSYGGHVNLEVTWPNGKKQVLHHIHTKGIVDIVYPQ